eukprot:749924-Hanusia_phi.AAC.3
MRCQRQSCARTCLAYSAWPLPASPAGRSPPAAARPGRKRRSCEGCRQKKVRCTLDRPCSRCGASLVQACRDCIASAQADPSSGGWDPSKATTAQVSGDETWRRAVLGRSRKQVDRACDGCRLSKVGCDKSRPCARCVKAEQPCSQTWSGEARTARKRRQARRHAGNAEAGACLREGDQYWADGPAGLGTEEEIVWGQLGGGAWGPTGLGQAGELDDGGLREGPGGELEDGEGYGEGPERIFAMLLLPEDVSFD